MTIPRFDTYYPSEDEMSKEQKAFYLIVEKSLQKGDFFDIQGNISYVFVYLYKLINQYNKVGFENLHDYLIYIAELYSREKKLTEYCRYWAYDCLLGLNRFEEYLSKTEPKIIFGISPHSNLRLNIQNKLGLKLSSVDILLTTGGRKSKFIIDNQALYKDCVLNVFNLYASSKNGWISIIKQKLSEYQKYPHELFGGVPIYEKPRLSFNITPFHSMYYSTKELIQDIKNLAKEAENKAREVMGVPKIGEGWVSETQLFRMLEAEFSQTKVLQHASPRWLGRQHFDIYFPDWNIAVEYHGLQHFQPVDFFGGETAFEKNIERDKKKLNLALRHGVKLFVVTEKNNTSELVQQIRKISCDRKVLPPV